VNLGLWFAFGRLKTEIGASFMWAGVDVEWPSSGRGKPVYRQEGNWCFPSVRPWEIVEENREDEVSEGAVFLV